MERLTNRIIIPKEERELVVFTQGEYIDTIPAEMAHEDIRKVLRKLAEYEDAEEQGLLLRLPCKVGDDIYAIPSEVNYRLNKSLGAKGLNAICRQVVDHIEFNSYGYLVSTNEGMTVHRQEAFGETWFLTRNEAEQKLKEMECD